MMYTPAYFAETDRDVLHAFIEAHSFATLVSSAEADDGAPEATHLPLLLDRGVGQQGQLVGHFARENPHWGIAADRQVVAIFQGPHAYISPTWYGDKRVVPTWNYVAVHARGVLRVEHDRERLLEIVRRTVDTYEAELPRPWSLDDVDADWIERLVDGIVGFTIEIEQIDGKWKLNQNQPQRRREGVMRELEAQCGDDRQQIARLMRARYT